MKRISVLGSTGSIGVSTLQVLDALPDRFEVVALGAGSNVALLETQVRRFRPETVAVKDRETARELESRVGALCRVVHSMDGLIEVATHPDADLLVSGLVRPMRHWGWAGTWRWPTRRSWSSPVSA